MNSFASDPSDWQIDVRWPRSLVKNPDGLGFDTPLEEALAKGIVEKPKGGTSRTICVLDGSA